MISSAIPVTIDSLDDVQRLRKAAQRVETACGFGRLVWHIWGDEGPPLVLLHGGSGSWIHWMRNIGDLVRAGHRVYAPDLPGFGESDLPPTGFDADAHTAWISSGLDELLASSRCDVVGFSFGAMVATFLARENPSRVARLVLVGAPALTRLAPARLDIRSWRKLRCGNDVRDVHRHNLHALMLHSEEAISDFVVDVYGLDAERDRIPQRRLFQTDILRRTMPALQCPVWGIWGEEDALHRGNVEPIRAGLALAPCFKGMALVPGAGHWVQFEASQHFNKELLAVLKAPAEGAC